MDNLSNIAWRKLIYFFIDTYVIKWEFCVRFFFNSKFLILRFAERDLYNTVFSRFDARINAWSTGTSLK